MYNSVTELHIGVDLALQQLNSNRKQVVKPEEKDWVLNTTMLQIINNHIDPNVTLPQRGADSSQRTMDYLNVLKVPFKSKPVVFYNQEDNTYSTPLPADYYRKSRINSHILLNIKETAQNPIVVNNNRILKAVIPFDTLSIDQVNGGADVTVSDYITKSVIKVGNQIVFDATDKLETNKSALKYDFNNIHSHSARFMMIATIIQECNKHSWVSCYWESYNGEFYSNSFIFVVDNETYNNEFQTTINEDSTVNYEIDTIIFSKNLEYVEGSTIRGSNGKSVQCKLVESEDFEAINNNPFFNSSVHAVNGIIENGNIVLKGSDDFKVIDIEMVYYRKPKLINYATGQNCEIPADDFKSLLVNMTAQKLNAFIEDENYQKVMNENLMLL